MFRLLRIGFVVLLGVVLLTVALANRAPVALRLLPEETGRFLGLDWVIQIPLFLAIFGGILAGLAIGFVWEWFREGKHRTAASRHRREVVELKHEVATLRDEKKQPKDEVLALLEPGVARR